MSTTTSYHDIAKLCRTFFDSPDIDQYIAQKICSEHITALVESMILLYIGKLLRTYERLEEMTRCIGDFYENVCWGE